MTRDHQQIALIILAFIAICLMGKQPVDYYIRNIGFRIRYCYRALLSTFGICPSCYSKMSRTGKGRFICTRIDCRK